MQVLQYNPLSTSAFARCEDLVDECFNFDFIGIVGTQRKAKIGPVITETLVRGRRKESAIMIQQIGSWKLWRMGVPHTLNNHDMTNAFASSEWSALDYASKLILEPPNWELGRQRYRWATVRLPTCDGGHVLLKTNTGGLMGVSVYCTQLLAGFC